ncbi:hypothetical protein [Streptomyces sp. NPDC058486]|uniref:hypothetical protein n=1 Tax=unclassified Streptomyces TaxID=2593676 RepID=UPI00364FC4F3
MGAGTGLLNSDRSMADWLNRGTPPWVNIWTPLDLVSSGPMGDTARAITDRLDETVQHATYAEGFQVTSADGLHHLAWLPKASPACWSGSREVVDKARRSFTFAGHVITYESVSTTKLSMRRARQIAASIMDPPPPRTFLDSVFGEPEPEPVEPPVWRRHWTPRTFRTPGPQEWPVTNRFSLARDHTSHCADLTQVQYSLARLLLNQTDTLCETLPPLPDHLDLWHTRRVRALACSRMVAAGSVGALVGLIIGLDVDDTVNGAARRAAGGSETAAWIMNHLSEHVGAWAALAAAGLTAFVVLCAVLAASWQGWHRKEALRLLADPRAPDCASPRRDGPSPPCTSPPWHCPPRTGASPPSTPGAVPYCAPCSSSSSLHTSYGA